jgi:hypothetical protein
MSQMSIMHQAVIACLSSVAMVMAMATLSVYALLLGGRAFFLAGFS